MPRKLEDLDGGWRGVLAEGEQVAEYGPCWAAQQRPSVPLLFLARRQLFMVLTDRRLLLFARWRRGLHRGDLLVAKRYEAFTMLGLRRALPLLQVRVEMPPSRLVFEFRPRCRRLGEALAQRLDRSAPAPAPEPPPFSAPPAPPKTPAAPTPVGASPAASQPGGDDNAVFWGAPNRGS